MITGKLTPDAAQALVAMMTVLSVPTLETGQVAIVAAGEQHRLALVAPSAEASPTASQVPTRAFVVTGDRVREESGLLAPVDAAALRVPMLVARVLPQALAKMTGDGHPPLANYDIHYTVVDGQVEFIFAPRLAPGERPKRGGATSLGPEVHYFFESESGAFIRKTYAR